MDSDGIAVPRSRAGQGDSLEVPPVGQMGAALDAVLDAAVDVDFVGDSRLLLTGPFFPDAPALAQLPTCGVPVDGTLEPEGRIVPATRSMDGFLRGSLTYGNPPIELLTHFAGSDAFHERLTTIVEEATLLPVTLTVAGVLFPDGYGSVAVRMHVPDGWNEVRRERLVDGFGPRGRDEVVERLRDELLPALAAMCLHCRKGPPYTTVQPYFNLTYAGGTVHPAPGRGTLADRLRPLIYPRSAAPILSDSTWMEEFFYPGYAFFLLAARDPRDTLDQLEHLLTQLNVHYARLERTAGAADRLVRESALNEDLELLIALEQRLRADYQALVRPTFSYDFHVLKLRDSVLSAWETDKVRERTDTLLEMARHAVERKMERDQAHRVGRVNRVVTIVAILSFVVCVDAAVDLWSKIFG